MWRRRMGVESPIATSNLYCLCGVATARCRQSVSLSMSAGTRGRLTGPDGVYRMTLFSRRLDMARKSKLTEAAVKIGTAIGKADRTAHQIAKAGKAAKDELADIGAQINTLKRQLLKTKKRLQRALK